MMMHRSTALLLTLAFTLTAQAEPIADILGDRAPIEIRRLIPSETPVNLRMEDLDFIAAYQVIGEATTLTLDQATTITDLTTDPNAFDSDGEATCEFKPGIAIRFGKDTNATDLLVCFACDEVATVPSGENVTQLAIMPQSSRDVLLDLAKAALPDDQAIQDLPSVRREGSAPPPFAPPPPEGILGR